VPQGEAAACVGPVRQGLCTSTCAGPAQQAEPKVGAAAQAQISRLDRQAVPGSEKWTKEVGKDRPLTGRPCLLIREVAND